MSDDEIITLNAANAPNPEEASTEPSKEELLDLVETLRHEHRRVDAEIKALAENGVSDALKIQRMKKIKLSIKDQIVFIENQLTPDIIA